jgi:hypothetical protein
VGRKTLCKVTLLMKGGNKLKTLNQPIFLLRLRPPLLPEAAPLFSPPCVPPASLLSIVRSADRDIWYQGFHPGTFPEPSSSQIESTRPRRHKRPRRTTSTATSNATTTPHPTTTFTPSSPGYHPGSIAAGEEDPPSNPNLSDGHGGREDGQVSG